MRSLWLPRLFVPRAASEHSSPLASQSAVCGAFCRQIRTIRAASPLQDKDTATTRLGFSAGAQARQATVSIIVGNFAAPSGRGRPQGLFCRPFCRSFPPSTGFLQPLKPATWLIPGPHLAPAQAQIDWRNSANRRASPGRITDFVSFRIFAARSGGATKWRE